MTMKDDSALSIIIDILIFVLSTTCQFLFVILIPYFNISLRKIPLLIVGLLFVKDVFLFIYISRAESLSGFICSRLSHCIALYAIVYTLRQLRIIMAKAKNYNSTITYIQYYLLFFSITIIF